MAFEYRKKNRQLMMRWQRLVRDYKQRIDVSAAMIQVAIGSLLLRRIAH